MLSPDAPYTPWVLGVVLAGLLALLVARAVRKDRRDYQRFKRFEVTADRQKMFRKWLIDAFVAFGGSSIVILVLVWRFIPRLLAAVCEWPIGRWFVGVVGTSGLIPGIALGLAIAIVLGTVAVVYAVRKTDDVPTIGDIGAILPRNRAELGYGAALSINAGLVEELLFRLAVPALIYGVFGNALVAVVASIVLFGGLHVYQGVWGIVGSMAIGALLMILYLTTGSILVAMIAHALIDLRSLVLIPVVVFRVHTKVPESVESDRG
ncbi:type II CAAX endopeptidase family protein [Glaciihabitans sp. UYNi722]|uniref:CPBP family intramembrane glutamic endopeptidase n=1 Tax=Glaciihabitans sp. UYNi722 TaxID=3156344 RepID=UPI0033915955